jgi:signal peptidase
MAGDSAVHRVAVDGEVGMVPMGRLSLATVLKAMSGVMLALAACTGLVIGGIVGLAAVRGAQVMVVTSGSMEPAIHVGSVIFVKRLPGEAEVGDVITFVDAASVNGRRSLTTHRVVSKPGVGGLVHYQTKGDANPVPDPNLAQPASVVGEVIATVPHVGRLYHVVSTFEGKMVLVVFPVVLLAFREVASLLKSAREAKEQRPAA